MTDFFSVVVPIHNEASYLEDALAEMQHELDPVSDSPVLLLVENGSTDDTLAVAERIAASTEQISVLTLPEANYGGAMREGLLAAPGEWVVTFDIDYFSGRFISQLGELRETADVVIASKRAPGSDDRRSLLRRAGTLVFNRLVHLILGTKVSDTHGIKAFRRPVISELAPKVQLTKDLFDTELVLRAERAGYRIAEVPVSVWEQRKARSSYLRRVPGAVRGLFQLRSVLPSMERRNTTSR
ncbi:MAG: glycosyltransferase [Acidimicrobiia bacterium]